MNAFAAGIDMMFSDPNIAIEAIYRAGGQGAGDPVRIVWRAPDQIADFGGGRFITRARMLDVRISEAPDIATGDTFEINGETFEVMGDPVRDGEALIWSAEVKPQ